MNHNNIGIHMYSCPTEILTKLFACLGPRNIAHLRLVCSFWNDIIKSSVGLHLILNDTKKGNRRFASSVKIRSGIVEMMTSTPFSLRYPNALTSLKFVGRPNHFWFLDQVLHLKNLTTLHLTADFFFLQDLTIRDPPIISKSSFLPNLQTLKIEIRPKTFYVRDKMACGVYPKMEEKLCERVAKNMFCILKILRSSRLAKVEILDNSPRCVTTTLQKFQWWGQILAEFIRFHQYSLKELTVQKVFIPNPEDPFTAEWDLGIPLGLTCLVLHILADLGTFHYWRALIEAQMNLEELKLHLSGSFWKRFPIQQFIKANRRTLKKLELILEFEVDSQNPEPDSTFDFLTVVDCDQLEILRIGPCGYLVPTINFELIPQLIPNLTALYLTFMDISTNQLFSIVECENLKILHLQCLIQIVNGLVSSPTNHSLVKALFRMRTLDSLAVDFITTDDRDTIKQMATQLFGKAFVGHGFFIPYDLEEEQGFITNQHCPRLEQRQDNQVDESNLIQNDHNQGRPSNYNEDDDGDFEVSRKCPCESRERSPRRLNNCVSPYCISAMVDFCEDLLRVGKTELWCQYMDGLIPFHQIKDYIPDHLPEILILDEDECSCQPYFYNEFDEGMSHQISMEPGDFNEDISDRERTVELTDSMQLKDCVQTDTQNKVPTEEVCMDVITQHEKFFEEFEKDDKTIQKEMVTRVDRGTPSLRDNDVHTDSEMQDTRNTTTQYFDKGEHRSTQTEIQLQDEGTETDFTDLMFTGQQQDQYSAVKLTLRDLPEDMITKSGHDRSGGDGVVENASKGLMSNDNAALTSLHSACLDKENHLGGIVLADSGKRKMLAGFRRYCIIM